MVEQPVARRRGRRSRTVGEIVIAADRGLCGGYNSTRDPRRRGRHPRRSRRRAATTAIVTVGRKAEGYFRFRDYPIDAVVRRVHATAPRTRTRAQVAAAVIGRFQAGELDLVQLVVHAVHLRRPPGGRDRAAAAAAEPRDRAARAPRRRRRRARPSAAYEFEPEPEAILDALLPRYAEARIYAALLNAAASEHAARQRAMKAATDNADELITQRSAA